MRLKLVVIIALLAAGYVALLLWERRRARADRAAIAHVIHVNGTRGKSTVCRLIEAGLRAGGLRVFCKTTGTEPMTIDVNGEEKPVMRRGCANIREQFAILHSAAAQGAQALVIECMALQPELQHASERILSADLAVITNVRFDHADIMGGTLGEICDSLCAMIPENGMLFTAETELCGRLAQNAAARRCELVAVAPQGDEPDFDFAENIALALAVCEAAGVARETALCGMRAYKPDPYCLSAYRLGGAVFINGMAANDVASTLLAYTRALKMINVKPKRLILLFNNRPDRAQRAEDMLRLCQSLSVAEVWLLGSNQRLMQKKLQAAGTRSVRRFKSAAHVDFAALAEGDAVYAVGNIAREGKALVTRVAKEGVKLV